MFLARGKIFYGWFVVTGSALVIFGIQGSQFSFGVFLKPMTEEFGWSRATLSLAFGVTFMLSGLLRPVVGYIADRHSPRAVALSGVVVVGTMLFLISFVSNLYELYIIFGVMSLGITLGTGPVLTKVVTAWFHHRRGVTLGILNGGGSVGGMVLVPAASLFLVLFQWQVAYRFLGLFLLFLILPVGYILIRNRPEDIGLQAQEKHHVPSSGEGEPRSGSGDLIRRDATVREALRNTLFWRLTFGYFV